MSASVSSGVDLYADAPSLGYFHVRKEDVHAGSALDVDPPFASFDVVLRRDYETLERRVERLQQALPDPDHLEEIADILDLFDRVAELADAVLPGKKENYRAADHSQMQDDLRAWAKAARAVLVEEEPA